MVVLQSLRGKNSDLWSMQLEWVDSYFQRILFQRHPVTCRLLHVVLLTYRHLGSRVHAFFFCLRLQTQIGPLGPVNNRELGTSRAVKFIFFTFSTACGYFCYIHLKYLQLVKARKI